VVLRAKGQSRDFIATFRTADADCVSCRQLDDLTDGLLGVEITRDDGRKDIVISAEAGGHHTACGVSFTGQVALLAVAADGSVELVDVAE